MVEVIVVALVVEVVWVVGVVEVVTVVLVVGFFEEAKCPKKQGGKIGVKGPRPNKKDVAHPQTMPLQGW